MLKFQKTFFVILGLALFVGCTKQNSSATISPKIEMQDYANRTITLNSPAKKIIVMADNSLVVIKQVGAIESVIALDSKTKGYLPKSILSYTNPNLKELSDVGKTKSPNYEYIISLEPDFIFFKGNKEACDTMQEKTGVKVASIMSLGDFDFDLYKKIGVILGKSSEAEEIIAELTKQKKILESKMSNLSEENRKTAYIVIQNSHGNLFKTIKKNDSLKLAGIRNVAEDANKIDEWGFAEISKEEFLNYNPDYIFLDYPADKNAITKEIIFNDSSFQFCTAIKKGTVYNTHTFSLPVDYVYIIAEAYYYAHIAYPDIITQTDYENAITSIFEKCYGINDYYADWEKSLY